MNRLFPGFVEPVSIGGFQPKDIPLLNDRWIPDDRLVGTPQIARKNDFFLISCLVDPNFNDRRSQNMPGILKTDFDTIGQRKDFIIFNRLKRSKALLCILHGVKSNGLALPCSFALAILPLRFHLLNVSAVLKHHLTEIEGGLGTDYFSSEIFFDQSWNQTTVVNVGM